MTDHAERLARAGMRVAGLPGEPNRLLLAQARIVQGMMQEWARIQVEEAQAAITRRPHGWSPPKLEVVTDDSVEVGDRRKHRSTRPRGVA